MEIIVIGTGMYVLGSNKNEYGTILPAIIEFKRQYPELKRIKFVGTNSIRTENAKKRAKQIIKMSGISLKVDFYPKNGKNNNLAYREVLSKTSNTLCAIVAVPDHLHFKIVKDCLNSGLHTLVVKPLTPTVKEATELTHLAKKNGLYGVVEFHKRFDKQNIMLKNIFNSGKLGQPLYSLVEYSQKKIIPTYIFKSWVNKTSILQYLGIHYIDLMHYITDAMPDKVMAVGQKLWLKKLDIDVFDSIQCMIKWKLRGGISFNQTLLVNWIDPNTNSSMSDQKIKFIGTKGRFEGDQKNRGIRIVTDDKGIEEPNPDFCYPYESNNNLIWRGYGIESVSTFLQDVVDIKNNKTSIKNLEKIRPTFKSSILSTAVIEYAHQSLSNGSVWKKIKLNK